MPTVKSVAYYKKIVFQRPSLLNIFCLTKSVVYFITKSTDKKGVFPMQSQVYILFAAAAVMFLVIGGLSLLAHYYTLNGIKSRTVGDGQHGTARFASKQEIKNTYQHIPFQPELWRQGQCLPTAAEQGIILGSVGAKNKSRQWWTRTMSTVS